MIRTSRILLSPLHCRCSWRLDLQTQSRSNEWCNQSHKGKAIWSLLSVILERIKLVTKLWNGIYQCGWYWAWRAGTEVNSILVGERLLLRIVQYHPRASVFGEWIAHVVTLGEWNVIVSTNESSCFSHDLIVCLDIYLPGQGESQALVHLHSLWGKISLAR